MTQQGITRGRGTALYTPLLQTGRPAFLEELTFAIRTKHDPADVTSVARAAVWDLDPDLAVSTLATIWDRDERTESASSIWIVNADGSGLRPLKAEG